MEPGGKDLGLRAVLTVRGDNPAVGQRTAAVNTEQMADMAVGHKSERCRAEGEQNDDDADRAHAIVDVPRAVLRGNKRRDREQQQRTQNHQNREFDHQHLPQVIHQASHDMAALNTTARYYPIYSQTVINSNASSNNSDRKS